MKGKWRIVSILGFALLHGLVTYLSFRGVFSMGVSHFDSGAPYTFQENMRLKTTFLLLSPYYFILYTAPGLYPGSSVVHGIFIITNSLLWGFVLDWVLRKVRGWMSPGPGEN
mgnify:CR=1 FL=1